MMNKFSEPRHNPVSRPGSVPGQRRNVIDASQIAPFSPRLCTSNPGSCMFYGATFQTLYCNEAGSVYFYGVIFTYHKYRIQERASTPFRNNNSILTWTVSARRFSHYDEHSILYQSDSA